MATRQQILANFDPQAGETSGYITAQDQKNAAGQTYDTFSPLLVLPGQVQAEAIRNDSQDTLIANHGIRIVVLESEYRIPEAPQDGQQYVRQNGAWAVVIGGGGGASDHGDLTGLDGDDHTQYALADGSRGSFAAPSHTHTVANLTDGASLATDAEVTAAVSAHLSGASHIVVSSTTPASVTAATGAAGSSADAARRDHRHQVTVAAPTNLGAANAAGSSTSLARADHVHAYPTAAQVGAAATSHEHVKADITDFGTYATTAQGALADTAVQPADLLPVEGGEARVNTVAASGATETLPAEYSAHKVTMDQNCVFTFPTPTKPGHAFALLLIGAFTPTFPASVDWDSATPPTYSSPSLYVFTTLDSGTTWLGSLAGSAFG